MKKLTHIDPAGKAQMVAISEKPITHREAMASCLIQLSQKTLKLIKQNKIAKGEVLNTARIAGVNAVKRAFELIPLTHPIPIEQIEVEIKFEKKGLRIFCQVQAFAKTGPEMEALVGAGICALTIYDMVKAVEKGTKITELRLEYKSGGKSGTWRRKK